MSSAENQTPQGHEAPHRESAFGKIHGPSMGSLEELIYKTIRAELFILVNKAIDNNQTVETQVKILTEELLRMLEGSDAHIVLANSPLTAKILNGEDIL